MDTAADVPRNPFTPTFGQIPPFMAGRDDVIRDLLLSFDHGAGDPNLASIFVGARGTGKTALLTFLSAEAASRGWVSASVSAAPGMLDDIEQRALAAAAHLVDLGETGHLTGITLGQAIGLEWERGNARPANWRTRMTALLDALEVSNTGLLIVVDEVKVDLDEMVQLATVYQHFVREGRKVSLLMAGLPSKVSALLRDDTVSFLRRASYRSLGRIDDREILDALRKTVETAGRFISDDALARAVTVIDGFPYMMQLVGYRMWEESARTPTISLTDVERGAVLAASDIEHKILETTYRELSKGDLRFLRAMLEDDGPSNVADIKERLGKKSNYVSQYKRRLMAQGVIEDCGHGMLRIELPLFKDYLRRRG